MALFFYIFASLMIIGSLLVITSKNPVHAVLWLIFSFCNASGLMVLIGAEFIAMMLIIIFTFLHRRKSHYRAAPRRG